MDLYCNFMKLHLGCGSRKLKGYIHVDLANYDHIEVTTSIDDLHMFKDETVDEIYCSHAFEYFDRTTANAVLSEWHRVLKIGAKLFLTVPDFDRLLEVYHLTGSLKNILGPLFGKWALNDKYIFHKTTWNRADLTNALLTAKFQNVEYFDPISFLNEIDASYDDYSLSFFPHMDRNGIPISLSLTAKKID